MSQDVCELDYFELNPWAALAHFDTNKFILFKKKKSSHRLIGGSTQPTSWRVEPSLACVLDRPVPTPILISIKKTCTYKSKTEREKGTIFDNLDQVWVILKLY